MPAYSSPKKGKFWDTSRSRFPLHRSLLVKQNTPKNFLLNMTCSNYCDYGCDPEGECEAWFSLPYLSSPPDPKTRSINPYFRSLKEKSGELLQAEAQAAQDNPTGEAVLPTASPHKAEGVSKGMNTKGNDTTCATETEEVLGNPHPHTSIPSLDLLTPARFQAKF